AVSCLTFAWDVWALDRSRNHVSLGFDWEAHGQRILSALAGFLPLFIIWVVALSLVELSDEEVARRQRVERELRLVKGMGMREESEMPVTMQTTMFCTYAIFSLEESSSGHPGPSAFEAPRLGSTQFTWKSPKQEAELVGYKAVGGDGSSGSLTGDVVQVSMRPGKLRGSSSHDVAPSTAKEKGV
ncbi:hypothetical protein FA13DRAFT_1717865, partial [Coprinellus micaceus]